MSNKLTDVERLRRYISELPSGYIFDASLPACRLNMTTAECCKWLSTIDEVMYHSQKRVGRWERV